MFIVNEFPKQQRWKECPRENNTKVRKVWKISRKRGLVVNFKFVT